MSYCLWSDVWGSASGGVLFWRSVTNYLRSLADQCLAFSIWARPNFFFSTTCIYLRIVSLPRLTYAALHLMTVHFVSVGVICGNRPTLTSLTNCGSKYFNTQYQVGHFFTLSVITYVLVVEWLWLASLRYMLRI